MKALLVCPSERAGVEAIGARGSLATWQILGGSLAAHWVEHLSGRGAKHVKLVTTRRGAEDLRAEVGDGARWGIEAEVISETRELTIAEAVVRHGPSDEAFLADCLPGLVRGKLFSGYEAFFSGVHEAFFTLARRGRVGAREIQPGVWVGLRSHIGEGVTFEAPCWLGEDVHVESNAHIGPGSVIEDRVWVGAGAEVIHSLIGPETSLGVATSLKHSIACGNTLIDWQTNSVATVADSFLLCNLRATPFRQRIRRIFARLAEATIPEPGGPMTSAMRISSR